MPHNPLSFVLDNFAINSETLTVDHKRRLDKMVSSMLPTIYFSPSEYWLITLVGSASQSGADEYNMALSKRRAEAVRDYLTPKLAGSRKRFRIVGIGEMGPDDAKIFENPRDRSVGVTAVLTGKLPKLPDPPEPIDIGEILRPRPPERKSFTLKIISYLIQSVGIGIPKTPLDVHVARIAMNFVIDDGDTEAKYTFVGEGSGTGAGTFFLGGNRSIKQGEPQSFEAYAKYKAADFSGVGDISAITGQFLLGGKRSKGGRSGGWHAFPMGTISKFKFPPAIPGLPGKEGFSGHITKGFKPLVPEYPKPLPPSGVF